MAADTADLEASLKSARLQLRLERTRAQLAQTRAVRHTTESYLGYTGSEWGDFVDPGDMFRGDGLFGFQRGGLLPGRRDMFAGSTPGVEWPIFRTEIDLDEYRGCARMLFDANDVAKGMLNMLRNFIVRTGYKYKAQPKPTAPDQQIALALAKQVQAKDDEFCEENDWAEREKEIFIRWRRDGEVFIRLFRQTDGRTIVRFVEPEQVRRPLSSPPEWSWGVCTRAGDVEAVIEYAVEYEGNTADWEPVPASEMFHLKANVDRTIKRGISDFYCTNDSLNGISKLRRALRTTAAVQAKIAWIIQNQGVRPGQVQTGINANLNVNQPPNNPYTGKAANLQTLDDATIINTGGGKEYKPGPSASGANLHMEIAQFDLRCISFRWAAPEGFTGDASNNNYASQLAVGTPFVCAMETEAATQGKFHAKIHWAAHKNYADAGHYVVNGRVFTFDEIRRFVDLHATSPQIPMSNEEEKARVDHMDMEKKVLSIQTRQELRGLDSKKEEANIKAFDKENPPQQQQQGAGLPGIGGDSLGSPAPSNEPPQSTMALESKGVHPIHQTAEQIMGAASAHGLSVLERISRAAVAHKLAGQVMESKDAILENFTGTKVFSDGSKHKYVNGKQVPGDHESPAGDASGGRSNPDASKPTAVKQSPPIQPQKAPSGGGETGKTKPESPKNSAPKANKNGGEDDYKKAPARKGEMAGAIRQGKGKEAKIVLADGSDAPPHIKPSMVPPMWTDVKVSIDPNADVLVSGRDKAGRSKTVYSDAFHMRNAENKFARVSEMLAKHEKIYKQNQENRADPKLKENADCIWLMDEQATRPGSDKDTKSKVKAYGATTLLAEHVHETPEGVRLKFIGKEGVAHDHLIRNPELAKMLVERKNTAAERGGKLFDTNYEKLSDYASKLDGGKFTPKDFRTKRANLLAIKEIANSEPPKNLKEYKARVKSVAERVSSVLGNRPQQALESYISPAVFSGWKEAARA